MKKLINLLLGTLLIMSLVACVKPIEDIPKASETIETKRVSENIVKTVPETVPTIKEIIIEETKVQEESKEEETESMADIDVNGGSIEGIEEEIPALEIGKYMYSNISDEKIRSATIPESEKNVIDLNVWHYGMTPIEWIYVAPNTQLISNNRPNSSVTFGYKVNASSGEKGCYIPIFSRCDMFGEDFEGRMYVYEDYTKVPVDEMTFSNKFSDLAYGNYNVKELLKKKYNIIDVSKGVVLAGDMLVNVVYVSELDEIIEGKDE